MKLSKKSIYVFILFIILINLAFRYPVNDHEYGADSFANHAEISALNEQHYDKRYVHPLSYFGLYPYSHNMGGMIALGAFSQGTGLSIETGMLFFTMLLGVLSAFGIYLVAREFLSNHLFGVSVAILFSLSRSILGLTGWTYSYRGLYLVLLPFLIFFTMKGISKKTNRIKNLFLSALMFLILLTIHRMTFFLIFFVIFAFLGAGIYYFIIKYKVSMRWADKRINITSIVFTILLCVLILLPLSPFSFYATEGIERGIESSKEHFMKSSSLLAVFVNLGAEYAMAFGVLIVMAIPGYFYSMKLAKKKVQFFILLGILITFAPFLADLTYAAGYFQVFLCIFSGLGLVELAEVGRTKLKKHLVLAMTISILLFAGTLPLAITVKQEEPRYSDYPDVTELKDETYNCAIYLKYQNNYICFSNIGGFVTDKVEAFSGTRQIKIPDYFDESELEIISFETFISGEADYLLGNEENDAISSIYYSVFLNEDPRDRPIVSALDYNLLGNGTYNVIVMNFMEDTIFYEDEFIKSQFLIKIQQEWYKIYDDGFEMVRFLNYNKGGK